MRSRKVMILVHFVLSFKIMCLNAWGWSLQLKHVAHIDKTNKILLWLMEIHTSILTWYTKMGWIFQNFLLSILIFRENNPFFYSLSFDSFCRYRLSEISFVLKAVATLVISLKKAPPEKGKVLECLLSIRILLLQAEWIILQSLICNSDYWQMWLTYNWNTVHSVGS